MLDVGAAPVTGEGRFQKEEKTKDPKWKTLIWFRMRREGRLHEFDKKRAKLRNKYRQQGYTRRAARDKAWLAAERAFPPLRPKRKTDEKVG